MSPERMPLFSQPAPRLKVDAWSPLEALSLRGAPVPDGDSGQLPPVSSLGTGCSSLLQRLEESFVARPMSGSMRKTASNPQMTMPISARSRTILGLTPLGMSGGDLLAHSSADHPEASRPLSGTAKSRGVGVHEFTRWAYSSPSVSSSKWAPKKQRPPTPFGQDRAPPAAGAPARAIMEVAKLRKRAASSPLLSRRPLAGQWAENTLRPESFQREKEKRSLMLPCGLSMPALDISMARIAARSGSETTAADSQESSESGSEQPPGSAASETTLFPVQAPLQAGSRRPSGDSGWRIRTSAALEPPGDTGGAAEGDVAKEEAKSRRRSSTGGLLEVAGGGGKQKLDPRRLWAGKSPCASPRGPPGASPRGEPRASPRGGPRSPRPGGGGPRLKTPRRSPSNSAASTPRKSPRPGRHRSGWRNSKTDTQLDVAEEGEEEESPRTGPELEYRSSKEVVTFNKKESKHSVDTLKAVFHRFKKDGEVHKDAISSALTFLGVHPVPKWIDEVVSGMTKYVTLDMQEFFSFIVEYEERRQLEQRISFRNADTDGSGAISIEEMSVLLDSMGMKPMDFVIKGIFDEVDGDGSGEIDEDEFDELWTIIELREGFSKQEYDRLMNAYSTFDMDDSGTLDLEESAKVLHYLHYSLSEEEVTTLFRSIDVTDQGQLSKREFLLFMRKVRELEIGKIEETLARVHDSTKEGALVKLLISLGHTPEHAAVMESAIDAGLEVSSQRIIKSSSERIKRTSRFGDGVAPRMGIRRASECVFGDGDTMGNGDTLTVGEAWKFLELYRAREGLVAQELRENRETFAQVAGLPKEYDSTDRKSVV